MHTNTITVSLNKLKASPVNVRKTGLRQSIEELAASIAAVGLLQPPVVRPEHSSQGVETGYYLVEAGERRRLALCLLAKRKHIKRSEPISCTLSQSDSGTEISLSENFHQCPMHPADQFDAFQLLNSEQGMGTEDIAARFGVTATVVKQRLRLAAVSPALIAHYRNGEMNLDQLMAFTVTDDHVRQEQVWEELSWNKGPDMIRRLLTKSHVSGQDRRAIFLGAAAYEAAGGVIIRDLFADDSGGYFTDSQLLDELVLNKLTNIREAVRQEGWRWVEVFLEFPYDYGYSMRRVYPEQVALSCEDQARIDALKSELAALTVFDGGEDISEADALRIEEIKEAICGMELRAYRPEDLARAGVLVTLDPTGALRIERGFVKPEDEDDACPEYPNEAGHGTVRSESVADASRSTSPAASVSATLPEKLILDLTAHRTAALQECLAARPDAALIAVVHALALRTFYGEHRDTGTCLGLKAETVSLRTAAEGIGDAKAARAMTSRHDTWLRLLPKEGDKLWNWLWAQDETTRGALMAYCAARTINALQEEPWDKQPRRLAHADELARTLALDMADWWQPTKTGYLARVCKVRILEAVLEGVSAQAAESIAGMKKDAMAEQAAQLLAHTRWLPVALRTEAAGAGTEMK